MHIFKHSLFRLKITVGCQTKTYLSIHIETPSRSRSVACESTYPSIHFSLDEDTLKITVGCLTSAYPSIHLSPCAGTLKITVGCPLCTYPSVRNKNLHSCWTPWAKRETRGLWARPPVLSPVPSQAVHSRACLNSHHSDIQGTAQKSPCVDTI